MNQKLHHTFSNISSNQEFSINDVIKELERVKDCHERPFRKNVGELSSLLDGNKTISNNIYNVDIPMLIEIHNACLVAKSMKEHGVETLMLNSGQDMRHQVLAQANKKNCPEIMADNSMCSRINPREYQRKLL